MFDRVNFVTPGIPIECLLYLPNVGRMSGDTVQTGTGKVVPARNFKCTTATREICLKNLEYLVQRCV